jgi:hypothetical protein
MAKTKEVLASVGLTAKLGSFPRHPTCDRSHSNGTVISTDPVTTWVPELFIIQRG